MMKRFFISTKANVTLLKIKETLGKQCFSAFFTNFNANNIYFVTLSENIPSNVLQQKLSSIISDPNIHIQEFDSSFDYRESYIYIDPTIPQIESLLDRFFVGGWEIEKGDYNLYSKVNSSRSDDCLNLACFLKNFGFTFSSSLDKYPVAEIQNLPPNFKIEDFYRINKENLHIQCSYVNVIDNGQFSTAYVLTKDMKNLNQLIKIMNMASISNFQTKSFHKFASSSSSSSNFSYLKSNSPPSSIPNVSYQPPINNDIPIHTQNDIYRPTVVNNQLPPNAQTNQYQTQPNSYPKSQDQPPSNSSKSKSNVKEILIYPSSFARTVLVEQSSDLPIDRMRTLAEKFGKVDRLLIIERKPDKSVFEIVYNKTGSCDTILKSNQFKECTKRAEIHPSPFPTSPVFEFYPEKEEKPGTFSLLDSRTNTVIVALEKGEDLTPFQEKLANFGIFNRILYQKFDDRIEVAVTFEQSGSMKTLLKCKEFLNSAAMADELFQYRSSQQYKNYEQKYMEKHGPYNMNQNRQQQQQQQMQPQFPQFFQPKIGNQFGQPPINDQYSPFGNQFAQPLNNGQFPQPPFNGQFGLIGGQFQQQQIGPQFNQPQMNSNFPPIGNQYSQPPNGGQYSQPPSNGQYPPIGGQFQQPPNNGQFQQQPFYTQNQPMPTNPYGHK